MCTSSRTPCGSTRRTGWRGSTRRRPTGSSATTSTAASSTSPGLADRLTPPQVADDLGGFVHRHPEFRAVVAYNRAVALLPGATTRGRTGRRSSAWIDLCRSVIAEAARRLKAGTRRTRFGREDQPGSQSAAVNRTERDGGPLGQPRTRRSATPQLVARSLTRSRVHLKGRWERASAGAGQAGVFHLSGRDRGEPRPDPVPVAQLSARARRATPQSTRLARTLWPRTIGSSSEGAEGGRIRPGPQQTARCERRGRRRRGRRRRSNRERRKRNRTSRRGSSPGVRRNRPVRVPPPPARMAVGARPGPTSPGPRPRVGVGRVTACKNRGDRRAGERRCRRGDEGVRGADPQGDLGHLGPGGRPGRGVRGREDRPEG